MKMICEMEEKETEQLLFKISDEDLEKHLCDDITCITCNCHK